MSHVLVVDGNSMVYRDFACEGDAPRNAARRIQSMVEHYDVSEVVCAWDCGPCFRHEAFPDYKANRKEKPEGIGPVITEVQERLADLYDIRSFDAPGFEGDDVIATLVNCAVNRQFKATVYSNDQDLYQLLIRKWVRQMIHFRHTRELPQVRWQTHDGLIEQFGLDPAQWIDYRIMVGDSSDNLPGFANVGSTRAKVILDKWQTLDAFYEAPEAHKIPSGLRSTMERHQDKIRLFRRLVTLRTDAELRKIL